MKKAESICIILLISGMGLLPLDGQVLPFELVPQTSVFSEARVQDKPGVIKSDSRFAVATAEGEERNQSFCNSGDLNISNATAHSEVQQDQITSSRLKYTLKTAAVSNGGHFVRCGGCLFGSLCAGRFPYNTGAQASARARVTTSIEFSRESPVLPYRLHVSAEPSSSPEHPSDVLIRLLDTGGETLLSGSSLTQTLDIVAGPGDLYQLIIEATSNSIANGVQHQSQGGEVTFSVGLEPAPIIEGTDDPLIGGGRKTREYPAVGALLWDGRGHCTGTLIGPRTVLTAAHCVFRYTDLGRMSFALGPDYNHPTEIRAVDGTYIPEETRDGIQYSEEDLINDIAIVHLREAVTTERPFLLPEEGQEPSVDSMLRSQIKLTFVGYGNRVQNGQPIDPGFKRFVPLPINDVRDDKFYYLTTGPSTCKGDSGGPALAQRDQTFVILGIASGGNCAGRGSQVRVESYLKWIRSVDQLTP